MNFGERDIAKEVGVVALSLALAVLTYRFVELPVRGEDFRLSAPGVFDTGSNKIRSPFFIRSYLFFPAGWNPALTGFRV